MFILRWFFFFFGTILLNSHLCSRPFFLPWVIYALLSTIADFWLRLERAGDRERSQLCELPAVVLKPIASNLDSGDVLDRFLPAYPCFGSTLRDGLSWPEYQCPADACDGSVEMALRGIFHECRCLAFLQVDSVRIAFVGSLF